MIVDVLANIPSPSQGVWYLGPLPLRGYALSIILGVILGLIWARRRYAARGGDPDLMIDIAIAVVPAGIIGGRIYHVITDWHKYFGPDGNPAQVFNLTAGGLGIWGAVVAGVLAAWAVCRWRGVPFAPALDAAAPALLLGQAIGRLGNWFNQELYGASTSVPWGLEIYERVDEAGRLAPISGVSTGLVMDVVHPTFLYELIWNLLAAAFIVWADKKFNMGGGRVFALYVASYTLGRFWIEMMRTDDATMVFETIRINTIVSAVVFLLAVFVLWMMRGRHREVPAYVRGETYDAGHDVPRKSRKQAVSEESEVASKEAESDTGS
ncbi:prolipoprotein diacylglyceryl transferase [Corynebacterium sputi]|uniref:prolipoprotein diacylglyceryl transferase n=1 Tax=Corynebacterium sputi TaxID=489915 RepID=UPI0004046EC3|nr:prolipoprotein diacylglyceryl transferase [Corynebacterium sputi]